MHLRRHHLQAEMVLVILALAMLATTPDLMSILVALAMRMGVATMLGTIREAATLTVTSMRTPT